MTLSTDVYTNAGLKLKIACAIIGAANRGCGGTYAVSQKQHTNYIKEHIDDCPFSHFWKKNIYRHLSVRRRKGRICAPHALPYKMYGIVNNHKNIRKSFIYHPAFGIINR